MNKTQAILLAIATMCLAVTASNILVQYQFPWFDLGHVLTFGAFAYPFAFLVNDLTNRRFGPQAARHVVYAGFITGLVVSWWLASPRIAIASGTAFLLAQLLDIAVFGPLRRKTWWKAPLAAAISGSVLDTLIFFSMAFAVPFAFLDLWTGQPDGSIAASASLFGLAVPIWLSLAFGDFWVKMAMALFMLVPYGTILKFFMPAVYQPKNN